MMKSKSHYSINKCQKSNYIIKTNNLSASTAGYNYNYYEGDGA